MESLCGAPNPRRPNDVRVSLEYLRQHSNDDIVCKRAEGYTFYCLYPETYILASLRLPAGTISSVIGIRSIGFGLAALVSAATGCPPPVSVRPKGHPFRRVAEMPEGIALGPAGVGVADEGPGLSGSSFRAMAAALEERGIPRSRVHFFPSHRGDPGPAADSDTRARWTSAQRHIVTFDEAFGTTDRDLRFVGWFEDLIGPIQSCQDVSGGCWRDVIDTGPEGRAPADPRLERRKFILKSAAGETFLAKFAGLGRLAEAKLDRARTLSDAGLVPEPVGMRHGFLIERWLATSKPIGIGEGDLVDFVGSYLGVRAKCLKVPCPGASLAALADMALANIGEGLGAEIAACFDDLPARATALSASVRAVATDNRMHRWEWRRRAGGMLVKTDAVDHCESHDLIGCQDPAWDIVGAVIEFGWEGPETAKFLLGSAAGAGGGVDPALLAFYEPCYAAFQLGLFTMARDAAPDRDRRLLAAEVDRYRYVLLRAAEGKSVLRSCERGTCL